VQNGNSFTMKRLALILFFLSFTSCNSKTAGNNTYTDTNNLTLTSAPLRAVYLVQGKAELSSRDLQTYPEIVVVQTFDEFKQDTSQKIALWIDKSATPLTPEQQEWLNEAPQAYYPTVLIGYNDTLYSFRDLLGLCCFMGPPIDWKLDPGFSVIQREETTDPASPAVSFIKGYDQTPTAQAILEVTNALLEGRLNSTPTGSFIPPSTPTIGP
jgi:hypothetical protein